jgi:hypothetical protein
MSGLRVYVGTHTVDARTLRLLDGCVSSLLALSDAEVVVVDCGSPWRAQVAALVAAAPPRVRMVTVPNTREAAVIDLMVRERDARYTALYVHDSVQLRRRLERTDLPGRAGALWTFTRYLPIMDVPYFCAAAARLRLDVAALRVGCFGAMCYADAPTLEALADMGWGDVAPACTTRHRGMACERLIGLALTHVLGGELPSLEGCIFAHPDAFVASEHVSVPGWFSKVWSGR